MSLKADDLAVPSNTESLVADLRRMIDETRSAVAVAVNVSLTFLYWRVGQRIRQEVLKEDRAEYGEKILPTLSAKLSSEYGQGWSERSLAYMIRFSESFPEGAIVSTLSRQLSWSHFKEIIYHVAEYMTELPPRKLLERKLHKAVETARARIMDKENNQKEK